MNPSPAVCHSEAERIARPLRVSVEETQTCYLSGNGLHGGQPYCKLNCFHQLNPEREKREREVGERWNDSYGPINNN